MVKMEVTLTAANDTLIAMVQELRDPGILVSHDEEQIIVRLRKVLEDALKDERDQRDKILEDKKMKKAAKAAPVVHKAVKQGVQHGNSNNNK